MVTKYLVRLTGVVLVAAACSGSGSGHKGAASTTSLAAGRATMTANGLRPGASGGPTSEPSTTVVGDRPAALVAVTTAGAVQALDPTTGHSLYTLATGAAGDQIALSPDGVIVFFETPTGCFHQISRVPRMGTSGATVVVTKGSHPAVSPDGAWLAYVHQPSSATACGAADDTVTAFSVVLRSLATGAETTYGLPPAVIANRLPLPIGHLSWAPDSRRLAVSIAGGQDNEQWSVLVFDRTREKYYVPAATGAVRVVGPKRTYYREAVFVPNNDLLVERECCTGTPPHVTSSLVATVDPVSGAIHHQVALGVATRDHTSLDSDRTGRWLLYLSGPDLMVSQDGGHPATLATGFQAADW